MESWSARGNLRSAVGLCGSREVAPHSPSREINRTSHAEHTDVNTKALSAYEIGDRVGVCRRGFHYKATVIQVVSPTRFRMDDNGYEMARNETVDVAASSAVASARVALAAVRQQRKRGGGPAADVPGPSSAKRRRARAASGLRHRAGCVAANRS